MTRKATDAVTTMGIDIGKISLHLIGLEGCFGSKPEVRRGPRNVRCWRQSGLRFRATGGLLLANNGSQPRPRKRLLSGAKRKSISGGWMSAYSQNRTYGPDFGLSSNLDDAGLKTHTLEESLRARWP